MATLPPAETISLLRFVVSIILTGVKFGAIYLAGVAVILALSTLSVATLTRLLALHQPWPRVFRNLAYIFGGLIYTVMAVIFALPDPLSDKTIAPSFTWGVIWSISLVFVGMAVCFICGFAAWKLLPLLDWLTGSNIAQDLFGPVKPTHRNGVEADSDKPAVKIQMGRNASFANCQHVSDTSPLTIETICKEMKPGQTLAIHKHDTLGIHNQDYVGVFHFFESPIDNESNN